VSGESEKKLFGNRPINVRYAWDYGLNNNFAHVHHIMKNGFNEIPICIVKCSNLYEHFQQGWRHVLNDAFAEIIKVKRFGHSPRISMSTTSGYIIITVLMPTWLHHMHTQNSPHKSMLYVEVAIVDKVHRTTYQCTYKFKMDEVYCWSVFCRQTKWMFMWWQFQVH